MLIGKKVIRVSVTRNGPKSKQQQLGFYVNLYLLKQRAMKPKSTSVIAGLLLNYIVVFFSCEEAYLFCSTFSLFFSQMLIWEALRIGWWSLVKQCFTV